MDAVMLEAADEAPAERMRWIPGGAFRRGSDRFYPEERPARSVEVRDG